MTSKKTTGSRTSREKGKSPLSLQTVAFECMTLGMIVITILHPRTLVQTEVLSGQNLDRLCHIAAEENEVHLVNPLVREQILEQAKETLFIAALTRRHRLS